MQIISLDGSTYHQGFLHGKGLKAEIENNVAVYFERFRLEGELEREEVLRRAGLFADSIERQTPAYADGMEGIAEGSGLPYLDIVALNVRYELLYHQYTSLAVDGCTSFAVMPEASRDGELLMGQNWDWIPQTEGALLLTMHDNGNTTIAFTEAGIFGGKIGFNSHGAALGVNGLLSTQDDWSKLEIPFHVRCWMALNADSPDGMRQALIGTPRSCSANFMVAFGSEAAFDLETAPNAYRELAPKNGRLVHTNHFIDPPSVPVEEPPNEARERSRHRFKRMSEFFENSEQIGLDDLKGFLIDHDGWPWSICRHEDATIPPQDRSITVCSVIICPAEGWMEISDGPPCQSTYIRFGLA